MRHLDFETISAFLEDDLAGDDGRLAQEHLDQCSHCQSELEGAKGLRNRIEGLPRSVQPRRALINFETAPEAIASSQAPRRAWWANPWLGAAALPAAAALVLWLQPQSAETPQLTPRQEFAVQTLEEACSGTEAQLHTVMAVWPAPLRSGTDSAMESGLQQLDYAIAETRAALAANPGDSRLADRLSSIYQKKLSLMRQTMQRWST